MAVINFAHREVHAKLVYFGATGAGTNTNVRELHAMLEQSERSELFEFGPPDSPDHSRFFEFLAPDCQPLPDFTTRFRVYSLPGGIQHQAHRREILDGVDGLVFVSDARKDRAQANVESLLELERMLSESGQEISSLPAVIQVNHVDAEGRRSADRVVFDLNPYGFPVTTATAKAGKGVLETQTAISAAVREALTGALTGGPTGLRLYAHHRLQREQASQVIDRHISRIESATRGGPTPAREAEYRSLPPGPIIDLPFLTEEFIGNRPAQLLAVHIADEGILVDVVMTRLSGADPRRLTLRLASRPIGVESLPSITKAEKVTELEASTSVGAVLPEKIHIAHPPVDASPAWYGVIGLVGGVTIGLLLGVLMFM